jgi:hypothetical protein
MSDKQLAHRIGMLVYECDKTDVFELNVDAADEQRCVVADEVTAVDRGKVVTDRVPLVIVGPGDKIEATIHMRLDSGSSHARFCPAEVVGFAPRNDGKGTVLRIDPTGALGADDIVARAFDKIIERLTLCAEACTKM